MIRDIDLSTRETHIEYWDDSVLYPRTDLYPDDNLYPEGPREVANIESGSMTLDEFIVDSEMRLGEIYSSKFEVTVYNLNEDLSGKTLKIYQLVDGVSKPIFYGKVDSCKLDNTGLDRRIVAYDPAYTLRDMDVSDWWLEFWENTGKATIGNCLSSMLNYYGIVHILGSFANDMYGVHKNISATYISFATVLSMLCELRGCFPHFGRDGILRFISFDPTISTILKDINGDPTYEGLESTFEDFVTDEITGVEFYDSEGEIKYVVGSRSNVYKLSSNIFCYDMGTSTIKTIGENLLKSLKKIRYTPASVKMIVGNLDFELGEHIVTPKGNFFIMENQYSGSQLVEQTMIAKGSQQLGESNRKLSDSMLILNEKYSRLTLTVEEFSVELGDYKEEVSSKFEQTAEQITFEVARGTQGLHATYQGDYVPTKNNYPANEWTTEELQAKNVGATFYNTAEGRVYRWTNIQNCLLINFDEQSAIGPGDYLQIFCDVSGTAFEAAHADYFSVNGTMLSYKTKFRSSSEFWNNPSIWIPGSKVWLYIWNNKGYPQDYYGIRVGSVTKAYSDVDNLFDYWTMGSLPKSYNYGTITFTGPKDFPETDHFPYKPNYVLYWDMQIDLPTSTDKYGWVPQEGFAYSKITQNADSIVAEVKAREFGDDELYTDYTSKFEITANTIASEVSERKAGEEALSSRITQNADLIDMKVSKGTVSSELSLEPDQIKLSSGRLIIDSGNFQLDKNGTVRATNAWLSGEFHSGSGFDRIDISEHYIKNNGTGNYIDMAGLGSASGTGIHINSNEAVFSTYKLGVTKSKGAEDIFYGYTGDITVVTSINVNFDTQSWDKVYTTFKFVKGLLVT